MSEVDDLRSLPATAPARPAAASSSQVQARPPATQHPKITSQTWRLANVSACSRAHCVHSRKVRPPHPASHRGTAARKGHGSRPVEDAEGSGASTNEARRRARRIALLAPEISASLFVLCRSEEQGETKYITDGWHSAFPWRCVGVTVETFPTYAMRALTIRVTRGIDYNRPVRVTKFNPKPLQGRCLVPKRPPPTTSERPKTVASLGGLTRYAATTREFELKPVSLV